MPTSPPGDMPPAPDRPEDGSTRLSIVIPVFNERENLVSLAEELLPVLSSLTAGHEVIFVDDGSTDGSWEILQDLRARHGTIRLLRSPVNRGQSAALFAGFRACRGETVVTMDGDGQNDPADIPDLLRKLPGFDAVVGYRRRRHDSMVRRLSSRVGNAVRNFVSGDDIIDTGCTLKAIRRKCLEDLPRFNGAHRFLPTLLKMEGSRVLQIPVGHRPRVAGRSKYGIANRLVPASADLLGVRWLKSRHLPLGDIEERT